MKTSLVIARTAAALFAAAALTTHAQTWTTVFDSSLVGTSGVCGDISTDAEGKVYAAGRYIAADGSSVAIVQGSSDQVAHWQGLDTYFEDSLSYAHNRAIAADPSVNGHLFAGGNLNNLLPNGTYQFDTLWFIRERNPVTGAWSTVDDDMALSLSSGQ